MTPAQKERFEAHVRDKVRQYAAPVGGISKAQEDRVVARVLQRLESGDMRRMPRSVAGIILASGGL